MGDGISLKLSRSANRSVAYGPSSNRLINSNNSSFSMWAGRPGPASAMTAEGGCTTRDNTIKVILCGPFRVIRIMRTRRLLPLDAARIPLADRLGLLRGQG
jgi:hypothetical protein